MTRRIRIIQKTAIAAGATLVVLAAMMWLAGVFRTGQIKPDNRALAPAQTQGMQFVPAGGIAERIGKIVFPPWVFAGLPPSEGCRHLTKWEVDVGLVIRHERNSEAVELFTNNGGGGGLLPSLRLQKRTFSLKEPWRITRHGHTANLRQRRYLVAAETAFALPCRKRMTASATSVC